MFFNPPVVNKVITMKKSRTMMHLVVVSVLIAACTTAEMKGGGTNRMVPAVSGKILIVYLSRTSNTKAVAGMIHQKVGGTLVALELQNPYPENYQAIVRQVSSENERGFLPPLKTRIDSMQQYDKVFVGFPTWGMQLPPPVKSFLRQYNLAGKTVVPFNTNGGYGTGSSFNTVKELCPDSKVLEGYTTRGGSERDGIYLAIRETREKKWKRKYSNGCNGSGCCR